MKGYLKNEAATEEAFAGGVYHSGDLAVWHADGSIEVKDRSKDIIISGGENISSLEVEEVLYRHPQVMEAAVVARSDAKWGEHPCAFVTLKPDAGAVDGGGHHRLLPRQHGPLQGAAHGRVRPAAQDLDRQDPEVRAARGGQEAGLTWPAIQLRPGSAARDAWLIPSTPARSTRRYCAPADDRSGRHDQDHTCARRGRRCRRGRLRDGADGGETPARAPRVPPRARQARARPPTIRRTSTSPVAPPCRNALQDLGDKAATRAAEAARHVSEFCARWKIDMVDKPRAAQAVTARWRQEEGDALQHLL